MEYHALAPGSAGGVLSRRHLLGGTAALAMLPAPAKAESLPPSPSLRSLGKKTGILYGLVEPSLWYAQNRDYFERLAPECNLLSPSNDFNWAVVEKEPSQPNYAFLDVVANFARAHDLRLIGHTLVWYHTVPAWAKAAEPGQFAAALETYISRTVTRFASIVQRWDVVNEPVDVRSTREDGLRESAYLVKLGPSYLATAFRTARAAAPQALLCLNEYGFEYNLPEQIRKRQSLIGLLRRLREDKVPIDCIGLQSHLDASKELDLAGLSALVREIRSLGFQIAITELDVNDRLLPADIPLRDRLVAEHVDKYLSCVLSGVKPISITNWGFTDGHSWLKYFFKRDDGLPLRPLAFDDGFGRKPMWNVIEKFIAA